MMKPSAVILPCGRRLHLQHGPIDLIIGVDQNQHIAFEAAKYRFETILEELVLELAELRLPLNEGLKKPDGDVAQRMDLVCRPHALNEFVTRMAAVAGSVADEIMFAMKRATSFQKAYVNNGGDIALYLEGKERFVTAMVSHDSGELGRIEVDAGDQISGIATSGRHGRSHSLGIADSVTVLAGNAAQADVAATLIANAVDIPGHSSINRIAASELSPDSDLGDKLVIVGCDKLSAEDQRYAIERGEAKANEFLNKGLIKSAAIFFQDKHRLIGQKNLTIKERVIQYA
jgi:ApbE superfamily uncharacterized protein (UPF0280 family)